LKCKKYSHLWNLALGFYL